MKLSFPRLVAVLSLGHHARGETDYTLPLSKDNVHWGYFSKTLKPVLTVPSGSTVTIETATLNACEDYDKMIKGDKPMEDIYFWDQSGQNIPFRGPSGTGDGAHIMTGPIYVEGAEPGDLLKVEILDVKPRYNPEGRAFGSVVIGSWGFQSWVDKSDGETWVAGAPNFDERSTIYEIFDEGDGKGYALASYQYHWPVMTDPQGIERDAYSYPGTCVPHSPHGKTVPSSDIADMGWTTKEDITYIDEVYQGKVPLLYQFGCMGLPPASHDFVTTIIPMPSGGNLDSKRIGKGITMYYPVEVAGALFSVGDGHSGQGDSELAGTGIETSLTGEFKFTVIKQADFTESQKVVDFPLGETKDEYIVHGYTETDYLETYFDEPKDMFDNKSVDKAMMNTFTQTRKWVMAEYGLTEAEATTVITNGVDFMMTQLVDGNLGMHSVIPKGIFTEVTEAELTAEARSGRRSRQLQGDVELKLSPDTVHWGYFSKTLDPVLTVASGDEVVVEMATHHACDDWDKMIKGDEGMESIYTWTSEGKGEEFRGASGKGDGVHILTGPIYVDGAEPGDVLKVEILDLVPRVNPDGKTFGSNAAAWWGYHYRTNKVNGEKMLAGAFTSTPGENDEVITIYEIFDDDGQGFATPVYQFEWPTITDPDGTVRDYIGYPGTCVAHDLHGSTVPSFDVPLMGWTKEGNITYIDDVFRARIPINYHVGCMGLAPESHDFVDSIPPMPTGGNLDNKRIGIGMTMYYPVEVAGALISMGDAHAAQGDSELDGTGIETSITGKFKFTVIKKADLTGAMDALDFPLGETKDAWIVHGFTETDYLETYADNPGDIYGASSVDKAMMNAFSQSRKFIMKQYELSEEDATNVCSLGVDYIMTQVVDGNWGVHAVVPKAMFETTDPVPYITVQGDIVTDNGVFLYDPELGKYVASDASIVSWNSFAVSVFTLFFLSF